MRLVADSVGIDDEEGWIDLLIRSIKRFAAGENCFSQEVQDCLKGDEPQAKRYATDLQQKCGSLSKRQLEVLSYLAEGHSTKEVAKLMHLSPKSVDSHKYRIMRRLGIHDRVKLARYAISAGLAPLDSSQDKRAS